MVLPITAMVIGAFASLTMLTRNSVLDEIGKQYVITARAKGQSERGEEACDRHCYAPSAGRKVIATPFMQ